MDLVMWKKKLPAGCNKIYSRGSYRRRDYALENTLLPATLNIARSAVKWLAFTAVFVIVRCVSAQWTAVPFVSVGEGLAVGGVATYSDGVVWVGEEYLFMSPDSGLTWLDRTPIPRSRIIDLFFFDNMNGMIVPAAPTTWVWVTSDQGLSWRRLPVSINSQQFSAGAMAGSPKDIILLTLLGDVYITHNGGSSWSISRFAASAMDIVAKGKGVAYISSGNNRLTGSSLYETQDSGRTWRKLPGIFEWDSFQFAQDQCDENYFYVANEDVSAGFDGFSEIFVSADYGTSYRETDQHPVKYHSGSIVASKNAIFAQTTEGIIRSTDRGLSWMNIGGPAHEYDTRMICAISNNILIASDTNGTIWRTVNCGGYPIPEATTEELTWYPIEAFTSDSLAYCDSMVFDTLAICPNCIGQRIDITDGRLTGIDTGAYTIVSFTANNLCYRLILGFLAARVGTTNAAFVMTTTTGATYAIPLRGTGIIPKESLAVTPQALFIGDTVSLCDPSRAKKLYLTSSSQCDSVISRISIDGTYAGDYTITKPVGNTLTGYDSLEVTFTPTGSGMRNAEVVIVLERGDSIVIPLQGVGFAPKPVFTLSSPVLFSGDTTCLGAPLDETLELKVSHCMPLGVLSQSIQGNFNNDYRISRPLPDSVNGAVSIEIEFTPITEGLRDAQLVIVFADGTKLTIQLEGRGIQQSAVSLGVANASTNTLGETVNVPFTIAGLRASEDVTFAITYDNSLEYLGAFTPMDIAFGGQVTSPGWVRLTIPKADVVFGAPSGYVSFSAFSDSGGSHKVVFDSLVVPSAKPACRYIASAAATAIVKTPSGCGAQILSRYIRSGELPQFTLVPNPVRTGELYVKSSHSLDQVAIEIINVLGERLYAHESSFSQGEKKRIAIDALPEGVYVLRISYRGHELFRASFIVTN